MRQTATLGSLISHGGNVITASGDDFADGKGIARLNDSVDCVIHGINQIISASSDVFTDGRGRVRVGDTCACGAIITSGSPTTFTD